MLRLGCHMPCSGFVPKSLDLYVIPLPYGPDPTTISHKEYFVKLWIESCEVAVKLKKKVDDSLHFLVVFVAVFVNAMFQSMVPVFNGEKTAKFLTSFTQNLSSTRFDVSDGIRRRVIVELVLLIIFELLVVCLYFSPPGSSGNNFIQVGSHFTFNFIFREN